MYRRIVGDRAAAADPDGGGGAPAADAANAAATTTAVAANSNNNKASVAAGGDVAKRDAAVDAAVDNANDNDDDVDYGEDKDERGADAPFLPWSSEDIFGQFISEALRPLGNASPRARRRSNRRLWWLGLLMLATAALQLGLVYIVCADVLAGAETASDTPPPDWFATTHLLLARLAGRRDLPSLLHGGKPAPGKQEIDPDAFAVGPCECRLRVPINETAMLGDIDSFDYSTGREPRCFLASVNLTECGLVLEGPTGAPATKAESASALQILRRADARMIANKYKQLLSAGGGKLITAALETTPQRARQLACTSLAVVVIAIFVRRELSHAMLGARIVLSHVGGCLPSFFSPLYLTYPPNHDPVRLGWGLAGPLLVVPLLHAAVSLGVMLAASITTFDESISPSPVYVILNSVAALFVLEVRGRWDRGGQRERGGKGGRERGRGRERWSGREGERAVCRLVCPLCQCPHP